jgi:predicted GNAT family N-acyltransferase
MAIWRAMDPRTKFEIIEHASESYVAGILDGEVVATCLLVPEAAVVRMKRVAVASSSQGRGIGSHMLQFCEAHTRSIGASTLTAHARETAVRFYLKNGFATEGEYFEEARIPHVVVRKHL